MFENFRKSKKNVLLWANKTKYFCTTKRNIIPSFQSITSNPSFTRLF